MTNMLRTIHRWPFEAPLALLLAVATAFIILVMPSDLMDPLPGASNLGDLLQPTLATIAAAVAGSAALFAMMQAGKPTRRHRRATPAWAVPKAAEPVAVRPLKRAEIQSVSAAPVSLEVVPRVRRADAHPDAPPRAPILATRDLGEPFSDPTDPTLGERAVGIPDGDYVELSFASPAPIPQGISSVEIDALSVGPSANVSLDHTPAKPGATTQIWPENAELIGNLIAPAHTEQAITNHGGEDHVSAEAEGAIVGAERSHQENISDMMARLDAGIHRRANGMAARDARPALREALVELNRLAARRI